MAVRARSYRKKRSFTLLELLLVIIMLAVILGASIPTLKKTVQHSYFRSFANKVYFFLDYARTQSIALNQAVEVHFNLDDDTIVVVYQNMPEEIIETVRIPADIEIVFKEELIRFYPDGTLSEFSLVLSDRGDEYATVESEGFNGKILLNINEKD